jgi:hypothetical protein
MAKTLTLNFEMMHDVQLSLSGLSFKAIKGTDANSYIIRDDAGKYTIYAPHYIDGRTSKIEVGFLVKILKDVNERVQFDRIKIVGYYQYTGEEIMNLITNQS